MHPCLLQPPQQQQPSQQQQQQQRDQAMPATSGDDGKENDSQPPLPLPSKPAALDLSSLSLTPRSEAARAAAAAAAAAAADAAAGIENEAARRHRVRVEARLNPSHPASAAPPGSPPRAAIERELARFLGDRSVVYADGPLPLDGAPPCLSSAVESARVVDAEAELEAPLGSCLLFWQVELRVTVYAVSREPAAVPPALGDGDEAEAPPYKELVLPHASLEGSMEAIVLPPETKARALRRLGAALALGGAGVDGRLVPSGRLALFHGPPGTGKTSLCKALAQRLAIRLCSGGSGVGAGTAPSPSPPRFPGGAILLEVSAPALFSRWFSESGRAVSRLFDRVSSLANEERALVFVVVDEVESVARSRTGGGGGGGGGGDPGDAMRAVNALLTGLDSLRDSAPGACVLCTSNLSGSLDDAFVDRADVVLRLGPPPAPARYSMLVASVSELSRRGVVGGVKVDDCPSSRAAEGGATRLLPSSLPEEAFAAFASSRPDGGDGSASASSALEFFSRTLPPLAARLAAVAAVTEGFSGRSLRRLPFAALSDNVGLAGLEEAAAAASNSAPPSTEDHADGDNRGAIDAFAFLDALAAAAQAERASRGAF